MTIVDFEKLTAQIPIILEYFVSGYIFIAIYQFFLAKKNSDKNAHVSWCVIISFLIKSSIEIFDLFIITKRQISLPERFIMSVVIACVLSIICVKLSRRKYANKLLKHIDHKSINEDIWQDIVDYDYGTTLHLTRKNSDISYWGILIAHEEKGLDSWIVLKDYIIEYGSTNMQADSQDLTNLSTLAVNLKGIEHIELYYNNDTKIFN